jgi:tight adherence protein B
LFKSGDLTVAIEELKESFKHHGSDQIFEALLIAKSLGGSELLQILRTLGDFLRQDLALRREIDVKHGWIKNSAHISAAAPWILLLLLSTQPSTAHAYSTPTGALILIAGLFLTAIAYLWMNRLGRLPQAPRVFITNAELAFVYRGSSQ